MCRDCDASVLILFSQRELLASKILEIGKSALKHSIRQGNSAIEKNGVRNLDAVRWLQKAFAMTEQLDDSATPSIAELKVWNISRICTLIPVIARSLSQRLILRSLGWLAFVTDEDGASRLGFRAARAYFCSSSDDPENLARADAALQELVASLDGATDHVRVESPFHKYDFYIVNRIRQVRSINNSDG
jgi:hypothetical protein